MKWSVGVRIANTFRRLTLAQQFMLASLVVLLSGMVLVGWWVASQIEMRVAEHAAATSALYVDSFVDPPLQQLGTSGELTPDHIAILSRLVSDTPLGQHIIAFKVWDPTGRVVYDTDPAGIGRVYPIEGRLARALRGEVVAGITDLANEENFIERQNYRRLLETYSPVNLTGSNQVIAVVEFYQTVDSLVEDTRSAQLGSWLIVAGVTLGTYLLLAGIVRRGSKTIERQQAELSEKVARLTALLGQNAELHERVRRAANRATALNERYLHRISAELHDGPAQELGLALLRLDAVCDSVAKCAEANADGPKGCQEVEAVQASLRRAMQEVRTISAGLRIPELESLTLAEALARVVRNHERRTDTKVALDVGGLPEIVALPVKITLFRVVQEALTNAYRHGGGLGQRVRVWRDGHEIAVKVSDAGPGFDRAQAPNGDEHLGLVGMRERVESIGGVFRVESALGRGTSVIARLSPNPVGSDDER